MNPTRHQIAAAFRAAKPYLWDGLSNCNTQIKRQFICDAICLARSSAEFGDKGAYTEAKNIIGSRLGVAMTLTEWLRQRGIPRDQLNNCARIQAHRHAWLDQLIAEFEAP